MQHWINLAVVLAIIPPSWWIAEKIDLWIHRRDLRSGAWSRYKQDLW
ncbi:hypothetical protein UFOVP29_368 [uncultured Caudovirales phage]|uniref:Uncharacterized protein n=1 Tax=uncultured Caudovirales phage TaxID=2100421 RepID=A0A6J5KSN1_9CAUD|nr:hypothetical protein UFOVP29_368 [uncultured Caudovirales phage]